MVVVEGALIGWNEWHDHVFLADDERCLDFGLEIIPDHRQRNVGGGGCHAELIQNLPDFLRGFVEIAREFHFAVAKRRDLSQRTGKVLCHFTAQRIELKTNVFKATRWCRVQTPGNCCHGQSRSGFEEGTPALQDVVHMHGELPRACGVKAGSQCFRHLSTVSSEDLYATG